tara:strand:+ start:495 stop:914 length:420 start_codon:yes stop_codon:yes gene_type:complete
MELLIQNGACVNAVSDGVTALHMAAYNQFDRGVRLLCRSNADVNAAPPGNPDNTPLHIAYVKCTTHTVRYLLCYGANIRDAWFQDIDEYVFIPIFSSPTYYFKIIIRYAFHKEKELIDVSKALKCIRNKEKVRFLFFLS